MTRFLLGFAAASSAALAVTLVRPGDSIARIRISRVAPSVGSRVFGSSARSFVLPGVVIAGSAIASFVGGLFGACGGGNYRLLPP